MTEEKYAAEQLEQMAYNIIVKNAKKICKKNFSLFIS